MQFKWKCDNAHGNVYFMDCFWSQPSRSGAQSTILGSQLRKAASHAAGMLVLI